MNSIGLQEAIDLLSDIENLNDPRLQKFISRIDNMATEVLKTKNDEYLSGAVGFVEACVITVMLTNDSGDIDISQLISAVEYMNDPQFQLMISIAFKMSVGLAILEELH
jgi:hypothetical protein